MNIAVAVKVVPDDQDIAVAADRIGRIGTVAMPSQSGFAVRLLFFQVCRVGGELVIISRIDAITSYYGVRID